MRRIWIAVVCVTLAGCGDHPYQTLPPQAQSGGVRPDAQYRVLNSFRGYPEGATPTNVTAFRNAFYGTTANGGAHTFGTVYVRTASGIRTLYSFKGTPDGATPEGALIAFGGKLYGTTAYGGTAGDGTLFSVDSSGNERVIYSFQGGNDGAYPSLGSLVAVSGTFYGVTSNGGVPACRVNSSVGCGIIFSLTPGGTERVVYRFRGKPDGSVPSGSLLDLNGTLYGTTLYGGSYDNGSVFTTSTAGTKSTLYSFKGFPDGANPYAGVIAENGTLYGTTAFGGAHDYSGTVYALSQAGSEQVLHSFSGYPDGAVPYAGLTYVKGTLYGTTQYGGDSSQHCTGKGIAGCGTIFSIDKSGNERVLYRFRGDPDGANPWGGLIVSGGRFVGSTVSGGAHGEGSLFTIQTADAP